MAYMCTEMRFKECCCCGACMERKPAHECNKCGEEIYPGEDYCDLGDYVYCEDCIQGGMREAVEREPEVVLYE